MQRSVVLLGRPEMHVLLMVLSTSTRALAGRSKHVQEAETGRCCAMRWLLCTPEAPVIPAATGILALGHPPLHCQAVVLHIVLPPLQHAHVW